MALGMIEVYGFTTSMVVADKVAKSADVEIVAIDKNKPANGDSAQVPLVMVVKFEGTAAAVEAGTEAGVEKAKEMGLYITHKIISRQSEDMEWFAHLSALGKDKLR
jgi:microcompartment protein CcmL/EutN